MKSIKLSVAEKAAFQNIEHQIKTLKAQQIEVIESILETREIDASTLDGEIKLSPDYSTINFVISDTA